MIHHFGMILAFNYSS